MTTEEFENSEDYKDMVYVGEHKEKLHYEISQGQTKLDVTVDHISCTPYEYLDYLVLYASYHLSKEIEDQKEYLKRLHQDKMAIISATERFKRYLKNYPKCSYDFSGFGNQIDATIGVIKIGTEIEFIEKQKELIENQKQTNDKVNTTNTRMFNLFIVSIVVAIISAYAAIRTANNDDAENLLKSTVNLKSQRIQSLDSQLQKKGQKIDSLEILLFRKATGSSKRRTGN